MILEECNVILTHGNDGNYGNKTKKNEIWKYYIKAANLKYDYFDDFVSLESLRSISYNSHKNFPTWLQRRHFL